MNEDLREMEVTEMEEVNGIDMSATDERTGSGKGLGLVVAGLTGVATLGALAYKKLKDKKKDDKKQETKKDKPRKKKRLRWVEIDDENTESMQDDIDEEFVEEDEE